MLSFAQYAYVLPLLLNTVHAYTTFTPNCSSLEHPVNFVNNTNTRSTLGILWSCLFTLIACTWTILHLNIPEQRGDRDPGWRGDWKWGFKNFQTKAQWMIITMLAPEWLLFISLGHLLHAMMRRDEVAGFVQEDGVPWSLTHSLYVDMGGFVIQGVKEPKQTGMMNVPFSQGLSEQDRSLGLGGTTGHMDESINIRTQVDSTERTSLGIELQSMDAISRESRELQETSRSYRLPDDLASSRRGAAMADTTSLLSTSREALRNEYPDSMSDKEASQINSHPQTSHIYHLTAAQLYLLRKNGELKSLPSMSEQELNARSKSDSFSKLIAMGQISWMAFQVIVRAIRHLAISQLELSVTAFSVCGVLIYAFCWNKPKDVQVPISIMEFPDSIPQELIQKLEKYEKEAGDPGYMFVSKALSNRLQSDSFYGSRVSNNTFWNYTTTTGSDPAVVAELGLILGGMIFGVLHILAWNFHFPTELERNLWRAASIVCTLLPLLFAAVAMILVFDHVRNIVNNVANMFGIAFSESMPVDVLEDFCFLASCSIYILARLYLLVEIFRTLFFLPVDAYTSTWATNIPHIA